MALIQCEECEKEISNKAEHCVHCGAPIEGTQLLDDEDVAGRPSNSHEDLVEGIIAKIAPDGSDYPWKYKIRDKAGYTYMVNSDVILENEGLAASISEGTILLFDKDLVGGRIKRMVLSNDLFYLSASNFSVDLGRILTKNPELKSSVLTHKDRDKSITRNYLWFLFLFMLLVAYWIAKGTPSPELIFASSRAKEECVRLADENQGSMMILANVDVVANDTWLKDGKRVVQLTQTDGGQIRTIMCLYGNGMVAIPSMLEQGRWR
jgi:hypothetical protein